jgi:hypothetical protein
LQPKVKTASSSRNMGKQFFNVFYMDWNNEVPFEENKKHRSEVLIIRILIF